MLKRIVFIVLVSSIMNVNSQDLPLQMLDNNGILVSMQTEHITGDFGRRECCSNKWHKGIDITPAGGDSDVGYPIKSICNGTIVKINIDNYRYIVIKGSGQTNFGYGHIFYHDQSGTGDFTIKNLSTPIATPFNAIIFNNGVLNYALTDADLSDPDSSSYSITYNGTTYSLANGNLHNTVSAGDIIAPIGNSGSSGAFIGSGHIHLYTYRDPTLSNPNTIENTVDPLLFLQHTSPSLNVWIDSIRPCYDLSGQINHNHNMRVCAEILGVTSYSGNSKYSASGGVTDLILNLNKIEVFLKKAHESNNNYELIQGAYFDSKFCDGSRISAPDNIRYPAHQSPANNTSGGDNYSTGVDISNNKIYTTTSAGFGNYRKTGIEGRAYSGSKMNGATIPFNTGHRDDYYINDFPTRIHQYDNYGRGFMLEASNNGDARFPDDEYVLYVKATTNDLDTFTNITTPDTLLIDNFIPYIKRVEVYTESYSPSNTPLYRGNWAVSNNNQLLKTEQIENYLSPGDQFAVYVEVSEPLKNPMNTFSMTLSPLNQVFLPALKVNESAFVFSVPSTVTEDIPLVPAVEIVLEFEGYDKAENEIIAFSNSEPSPTYDIPVRVNSNTWSAGPYNAGADASHSFIIGCTALNGNKSGECIVSNFDTDVTIVGIEEPIDFNDLSSENVIIWFWDFGDGNSSTDQNPVHTYTEPGEYSVSLYVSDGVISANITKEAYIKVFENTDMYADFTAITSTLIETEESVTFRDQSQLGTDCNSQYWLWDFGDGETEYYTSFQSEVTHTYNSPGEFTVTLVVCSYEYTRERVDYVKVLPYIGDDGDIVCIAYLTDNYTANFTGGYSGNYYSAMLYPRTYTINFGDGTVMEFTDIEELYYNHTYSEPGNYYPFLEVRISDENYSPVYEDVCFCDVISIDVPDPDLDVDLIILNDDFTPGVPITFSALFNVGTGPFFYLWRVRDQEYNYIDITANCLLQDFTYTFYEEDTFIVEMEVWDSYGGYEYDQATIYIVDDDVCHGNVNCYRIEHYPELAIVQQGSTIEFIARSVYDQYNCILCYDAMYTNSAMPTHYRWGLMPSGYDFNPFYRSPVFSDPAGYPDFIGFTHTFDQVGVFKVGIHMWNNQELDYDYVSSDPLDPVPHWTDAHEEPFYSFVFSTVVVKDCDDIINSCEPCLSPYPVDLTAKIIRLGGDMCGPYSTVKPEDTLVCTAHEEIVLRDGFVAESNSDFTAQIIDCGFNYIYPGGNKLYDDTDKSLYGSGSSEVRLSVTPNPTSKSAIINCELPYDGVAVIEIFNLFGDKVQLIRNEQLGAGNYSHFADLSEFANGIYLCVLTFNGKIYTERIIKSG